jgi:hypothetical protein
MDWESIHEAGAAWRPKHVRPPVEAVYLVEVPLLDAGTGVQLGVVERFARWSGQWWCCWAIDARRAAMCLWRGPLDGYRWRSIDA